MHRSIKAVTLAGVLAALAAAPVAAGAPDQVTWSDSYEVLHDCGIVESTTVTARETAFVDEGGWQRSIIRFRFDGRYTGPGGQTFASTSHQVGVFTPDTGAISGQGTFLHGAGGVLVMDVGHLVFDIETGATLAASARVIRFDDPAAFEAVDVALCDRLG